MADNVSEKTMNIIVRDIETSCSGKSTADYAEKLAEYDNVVEICQYIRSHSGRMGDNMVVAENILRINDYVA